MDDEEPPLTDVEFSVAVCEFFSQCYPPTSSPKWFAWKQYVRELNAREEPDRSWSFLANVPKRLRREYLIMMALIFG